nr:putative ribonuclease H-like domain-containing protein [Tanacetum cinerariifolium]
MLCFCPFVPFIAIGVLVYAGVNGSELVGVVGVQEKWQEEWGVVSGKRENIVWLNVPVQRIRTDNGTEFVNQTFGDYYKEVGISHETSVARSPQQNGVVKRRNLTLIEAARTMLIYAQAPLFLWAEAVATACFTQNRSIFRLRHGKTSYELMHTMASKQSSSGPALNDMIPGTISSGLVQKSSSSTSYVPPSRNDWDLLF